LRDTVSSVHGPRGKLLLSIGGADLLSRGAEDKYFRVSDLLRVI